MTHFLTEYGTTTGPVGIPMTDDMARTLDNIIKDLDEVEVKRMAVVDDLLTKEDVDAERSDVSWISTEAVDREGDVVLSRGMDNSHFLKNPLVTMQHRYHLPPVGKSAWQKAFTQNGVKGIKAKTVYPRKPDGWPGEKCWEPDVAFGLLQKGLAHGKSIGFIPLQVSPPTAEEKERHPEWAKASRVIRKWILLEYAVTWLPMNQDAVVESINKSFPGFDLGVKTQAPPAPPADNGQAVLENSVPPAILTEQEIRHMIQRQFAAVDPQQLVQSLIRDRIDAHRGRV